jgi:hypothetical protein
MRALEILVRAKSPFSSKIERASRRLSSVSSCKVNTSPIRLAGGNEEFINIGDNYMSKGRSKIIKGK